MRTIFAPAIAALMVSGLGCAAHAGVYIGLKNSGANGGALTTVATGTTGAVYGNPITFLSYGNYEANALTAVDPFDPGLLTTTLSVHNLRNTNSGVFDLYFTTDDLEGPVPTSFVSAFTLNDPFPAGWSLFVETLVDANNGVYSGTQIYSHTFTGTGVTGSVVSPFTGNLTGPYSVTQHYRITPSGNGRASLNMGATGSTTAVSSVVPEPATWAIMLVGFAGVGAALRGNRRRAITVA